MLNAQIRNYVGVVREQYHPELVSFLEEFRDALNINGYSSYADYINSYLKGSFGSGFVYVDANGNNYIITNRHVVSQADTVSIEFEDSKSDTMIKYEGLTVAALDENIDLAVLKFKDNAKPFKRGIPVSTVPLKDGQEVWSAGFPGLAGEPVWQLGKGTVTNANAKIKELLDPSISSLIQHSAEVDGGNSGGPLLISSKNSIGYEVVGINTWKAFNRQNTNFSIPAKLINTMINKANNPSDSIDFSTIQNHSEKFVNILNNDKEDFTSIVKYISDELTLNNGKDDFIAAIRYAYSDDRSIIVNAFRSSPIEGLRYAVAYQLWKKYSVKNNPDKFLSQKFVKLEESIYMTELTAEGLKKTISVSWINEKNSWRISSIGIDGEKKSKKEKSRSQLDDSNKSSGISISPSTSMNIELGCAFNYGGDSDPSLCFIVDNWIFDCVGINIMYKDISAGAKYSLNTVAAGANIRLPLEIFNGSFILEFQGKVDYAFSLAFDSKTDNYMGFHFEGGANFIYKDKNNIKPGIGLSYSLTKLKEPFSDEYNIALKEIQIYGIIAF